MAKSKSSKLKKSELKEVFDRMDQILLAQKHADEAGYPPPEVTEGETRKEIARNFVRYYFILLGLLITGVPVYNLVALKITGQDTLHISLGDIMQTFSAIVGPALGFVIAYYFKSKNES